MTADSLSSPSGLTQLQKTGVTGLIVSVCGAALYSSIASFQHNVPTYNMVLAARAAYFVMADKPVLHGDNGATFTREWAHRFVRPTATPSSRSKAVTKNVLKTA